LFTLPAMACSPKPPSRSATYANGAGKAKRLLFGGVGNEAAGPRRPEAEDDHGQRGELSTDRLRSRKQADQADSWNARKRCDGNQAGLLQCADTLAGKDHGKNCDHTSAWLLPCIQMPTERRITAASSEPNPSVSSRLAPLMPIA